MRCDGAADRRPIRRRVRSRAYLLEVPLPSGFQFSGVALANQVRSFDWTQRRLKVIEAAPTALVESVLDILVALLEQD